MKKPLSALLVLVLAFISTNIHGQYGALNFSLLGQIDPETTFNQDSMKYSGCWGWYQADKQKEYGIACSNTGTYWIDITVPSSPTVSAYHAGAATGCTWREAKSYKNFLYVISDDWGTNSYQIFDMQYLPDSVHKIYDGTKLFRQGHTLWIDGDHLYVGSVSAFSTFSSMCVYSLADPANPVKLRALGQDFPFINLVHDMYVRHDTIYASCGYQGLVIFKFTGTAFKMLGSLTSYTASGYNHSSALTPDGRTLVFADEVPAGLPIKVCDVTNLSNIQLLATANQYTKTTPHNPFVPNNELCFLSSYQDGLQLYDISNPSAPLLAGYFDTYPQGGGNVNSYKAGDTYNGQWGCYPFFPSGNVFALDRLNGAFVLNTPLFSGPYIDIGIDMPSTACVGSTLQATVMAPGASSVSWSGPGLAVTPAANYSATMSFTAPGIYTVGVTASHSGSTAVKVHTVNVISTSLSAVANATNPSCHGCQDGVINVVASAGLPPFAYSWIPSGAISPMENDLVAGCYTVTISDMLGCRDTVQACLVDPPPSTGIDERSRTGPLFYPNPVDDKLFVNMPADVSEFAIYNLLGEKVLSGSATQGTRVLDVSTLAKGVYILTLSSESRRTVANFIVE